MNEKNLWVKLGLVSLLVGMCAWQSWPPGKRLKQGIDLGGGHSLIFEIDTSGTGVEEDNLAEKVMTTLKQRVDPQGQRNLVWRPIGKNRLEIQIPRPPTEQKQLREKFEEVREKISATNLTETQIRDGLALPPE